LTVTQGHRQCRHSIKRTDCHKICVYLIHRFRDVASYLPQIAIFLLHECASDANRKDNPIKLWDAWLGKNRVYGLWCGVGLRDDSLNDTFSRFDRTSVCGTIARIPNASNALYRADKYVLSRRLNQSVLLFGSPIPKLCRTTVADPGGVQGVQTPALLFRSPFLKRTYFENMSLRFLAEQSASWTRSRNYRNLVRDLT